MANQLFPVFDVPAALAEDVTTTQRYHPAPHWDLARGDFIFDGARQVQYGTGFDAWVLWCIKTIKTQRWAHLAYSGNTGIEAIEAFRETDRRTTESAFERTITEALLADPMGRTTQVRNFQFNWENGGDSLLIQCDVLGMDGNSATITAPVQS